MINKYGTMGISLIIFATMVLLPFAVIGQNGYYVMHDNNSINLCIHDDAYSLSVVYADGDIISIDRLSCGNCRVENGQIVLKDSVFGHETRMEFIGKNLRVVSGYRNIKGRCFLWEAPAIGSCNNKIYVSVEVMERECDRHKCADTALYFMPTHYVFANLNWFFDLFFTEDGTFSYTLYGIPILEGSFFRESNLLILTDDCMETPFYVFIEQDGIIPFLPALFGTRLLKPFNKEEGIIIEENANYEWIIED